jgi:hypothetical protein
MVRDATGKGQRLDMSTYVSNVDKFKVMTINEFSEWKKNEDTALQTNLSDEFLKENAVGYNTCIKTPSTVKKTLYNMPLETDKS